MSKSEEDNILTHLKFYSQLQEGEKIESSNPLSVTKDGFISNFFRTIFFTSNRHENLEAIKSTISKVLDIIEKYSKDPVFLQIEYILEDLNKLVNSGLVNLCKTYSGDRMYCSAVSKLIDNIHGSVFKLMLSNENIKKYIWSKQLFTNIKLNNIDEMKKDFKEMKEIKQEQEIIPKVGLSDEKKVDEKKNSKEKEEEKTPEVSLKR